MIQRRLSGVGVIVLVVLLAGALVEIGRLERSHEQARMASRIAAIRAAIGPSLERPGPKDYLSLPGRTCLLYAVGERIYALELCFDDRGRIVEAVDRRGTTSKFYSIAEEPGAARLHVDPKLVTKLAAPFVKQVAAAAARSATQNPGSSSAAGPPTWSAASGGFEKGISGWHDSCSGCGQPLRTRDTLKHKFGRASMKVVASAINQNADFWNVPVTGGATYTLSAWVYQETGRSATIGLRCAAPESRGGAQAFTVPSGLWTLIALTFTPGPRSRECSDLQVSNGQDGPLTYWVDGVALKRTR